jgi:hypothetical protein
MLAGDRILRAQDIFAIENLEPEQPGEILQQWKRGEQVGVTPETVFPVGCENCLMVDDGRRFQDQQSTIPNQAARMCEAAERVEHVVHDAGKDDDIERRLARFAKGGAEIRQLDSIDEVECGLVRAADRRELRAGVGRPVIGDDPARTPPAKHGRDQAFHCADVQAPPPLRLSPAEGGAGKRCAREILSFREHAWTELHAIVPTGQRADLLVGEPHQVVRDRRPIHKQGARAPLFCGFGGLRRGVAAKKGLSPLRRLEDHLPFVRFEFGVEERLRPGEVFGIAARG